MPYEILYTSAPSGLKPGSSGYCTVKSSRGIPAPAVDLLESLSGYRHVFTPGSPEAGRNPVNWGHYLLRISGRTEHVLSRVSDCELDYTGRSNKLAHHMVIDATCPAGPAWLVGQPGWMIGQWDGQVEQFATQRKAPMERRPAGRCAAWEAATGDAGWGGVLAESFLADPERKVFLIYRPDQNILPLIEEAIALLPENRQWEVTFATYGAALPKTVECAWTGVVAGSPEVQQSRRFVNALQVDLSAPMPKATGGPLVEFARTGTLARPTTATRRGDHPAVEHSPVLQGGGRRNPVLPAYPQPALPVDSSAFEEDEPPSLPQNRSRPKSRLVPIVLVPLIFCLAVSVGIFAVFGRSILRKWTAPDQQVAQVEQPSAASPIELLEPTDAGQDDTAEKKEPSGTEGAPEQTIERREDREQKGAMPAPAGRSEPAVAATNAPVVEKKATTPAVESDEPENDKGSASKSPRPGQSAHVMASTALRLEKPQTASTVMLSDIGNRAVGNAGAASLLVPRDRTDSGRKYFEFIGQSFTDGTMLIESALPGFSQPQLQITFTGDKPEVATVEVMPRATLKEEEKVLLQHGVLLLHDKRSGKNTFIHLTPTVGMRGAVHVLPLSVEVTVPGELQPLIRIVRPVDLVISDVQLALNGAPLEREAESSDEVRWNLRRSTDGLFDDVRLQRLPNVDGSNGKLRFGIQFSKSVMEVDESLKGRKSEILATLNLKKGEWFVDAKPMEEISHPGTSPFPAEDKVKDAWAMALKNAAKIVTEKAKEKKEEPKSEDLAKAAGEVDVYFQKLKDYRKSLACFEDIQKRLSVTAGAVQLKLAPVKPAKKPGNIAVLPDGDQVLIKELWTFEGKS